MLDYLQTANQFKDCWRKGFDKDKLWRAYLIACKDGWRDPTHPLEIADFQLKDSLEFLLKYPYMFWDWCRESGKTLWGSLLMTFCTICGEECYWMAKASNQFMRVQRLWNLNPFIVPRKPFPQRREVSTINGETISMSILDREENASGPHPYLLILDEYAQMDLELIAKAMFMPQAGGRVLVISTPILGSPTTTIRQDPKFKTITHTYLDCKWRIPSEVESRKIKGMEWKWEQDMNCKEVLAQGAVFPNVSETHSFPIQFDRICQGVDFNGTVNKNICIQIGYRSEQLFILKEIVFQYKLDDRLLQSQVLEYPTEVESGGWNDIFAPNLTGVTKMSFAENKGLSKIDRIKELLKQIIYINPQLCPNLLKDLRNALWGADEKVDTNDLHYLSALMHAVGAKPRYLPSTPSNQEVIHQEMRREKEYARSRLT